MHRRTKPHFLRQNNVSTNLAHLNVIGMSLIKVIQKCCFLQSKSPPPNVEITPEIHMTIFALTTPLHQNVLKYAAFLNQFG